MKVSKSWLQELVSIKNIEEVEKLLPLRTICTKEITPEFIELDMKGYNRADLLSLRGVAYEVAAITDSTVKFTEPKEKDLVRDQEKLPKVRVVVEDKKLCPVYCVAKIGGLKVEPSSGEWKKKLEDSGLRSINNVADITNLIMLEYGQPLHAFDTRAVKDETIVVRTAKKGERITTLDGKTRDLETTDLLIADPQNNLGIAGVMGGKDSEVSESTTTILLEAAIFDPKSLRKTSQRLGLPSEASKRFYHGLTRIRLLQALDTAIRMYQSLGGKLTALTIVGDIKDQRKIIPLTLAKTNSLIGIDLKAEQVEEYLKKLNFDLTTSVIPAKAGIHKNKNTWIPDQVRDDNNQSWVVTPPYFRLDIDIEEDLIEEVARMYGYEKILAKPLPGNPPLPIDQKLFELIYSLKKALADLGLTETQTYSFDSTKVLEALGFDEAKKQQLVKVANPISAETEYLRDQIWPNLLEVVAKNLKHEFNDVAIFEIGKVYSPKENHVPEEKYELAIAIANDQQTIPQQIHSILSRITLLPLKSFIVPGKERHNLPHKYIELDYEEQKIGFISEVHPRITNKFGVEKRVAVLEIELEPYLGKIPQNKPLSKSSTNLI